jgi:fructokinase
VNVPVDIVVVGEALIDLVDPGDDSPALAHSGGSPLNVAVGLARLGQSARFVGRFSHDPFGTVLRGHATRSGVDVTSAVTDTRPSTIALVHLRGGIADYEFFVDGTADFAWTDAELAACAGDPAILHFGSLASWLPPGDTAIARFVADRRARGGVLISYDPNVRPGLQPDPDAARAAVESTLASTHLVKASAEDLRWLYGDRSEAAVAQAWLALGPTLLVVTHGGEGSWAYATGTAPVHRPVPAVAVVDTVGAGDAFMSGLLDGLVRTGATTPSGLADVVTDPDRLAAVLDRAALIAAITCTRAGADPPRLADVDAIRD